MVGCEQYELNLPYPKVSGEPDPHSVALLHEDYAGIVSEMTAASQYMYQHMLMSERDSSFAHEIKCIAIAEMRHKDMLGMAIVQLGGTPRFAGNDTYWCANFVNYTKDQQGMLLANIQSEYAAIYNYRYHIQLISNPSVQQLLQRIILDEELHIRLFSEMLSAMN